jgi:hypothetical protein
MKPGGGQRAAVRCSQDIDLGGLVMVARLVLGVVLTAAVLTACGTGSGGQPSHPATTPGGSSSPPTSTVAGTTAACAQQYHAWQNGPAHSTIIKFEAAQIVLDKDSSSGQPTLIAAALNILGQQAAALAAFPVPSCADPRGFFAALLSQIVTVTGEVGPGATLTDLQQAINQLGSVFSLESDFTAEVKQTTGN